jgi:hypothetical protein
MSEIGLQFQHWNTIRRQVRLIALIDSAEKAGLAPFSILRLHTLAFLSNVLAPVWEMPVLEGKVLKRKGGPFYPELQRDLDGLVGLGIVAIFNLGHVMDEHSRWRLEGSYQLRRSFADPILDRVRQFEEERELLTFLDELALALSALSDDDIDQATTEDAIYSDPIVDFGNVLDFAEWQQKNAAAASAARLGGSLPGVRANRGEMIHLYLRHVKARLDRGR